MSKNSERAVEEQAKFQFYFVALNFTLLAASIQSAALENYDVLEYSIETAGWLCLLASGLTLLTVLERRSMVFSLKGQFEKIRELGASRGESFEDLQEMVDSTAGSVSDRYHLGRWFFVLGISLVVLARIVYGYGIVI